MDSLLKTFSIGFLLRSVFAGIFFVVSYYVAFYGLDATVMKIEAKSISSPALLVGLFVGVVVYGVHRSLIYPFIEFFLIPKLGKLAETVFHLLATQRWKHYVGDGIRALTEHR